jgi:hypothetical protein
MPDYGQKNIQGVSAFADFDFRQHIGVEASSTTSPSSHPTDLGENSIFIGPRFNFPIGRYNIYGKASDRNRHLNIQEVQDNPQGGAGLLRPTVSAVASTFAPPSTSTCVPSISSTSTGTMLDRPHSRLRFTFGAAYRFR